MDDLESFFRRSRLKEFFLDEDENNDAEPQSQFRPPSLWMPPKGGDAALETYIRKFRADVQHQLKTNYSKRCTSNERIALRQFQQHTDVVIKRADKGSVVVVLSKEDYIIEAE